jgi:hypothetical protein
VPVGRFAINAMPEEFDSTFEPRCLPGDDLFVAP